MFCSGPPYAASWRCWPDMTRRKPECWSYERGQVAQAVSPVRRRVRDARGSCDKCHNRICTGCGKQPILGSFIGRTDMRLWNSGFCLLMAAAACITGCGKQERNEAVQLAKALTAKKADYASSNTTEKDFVERSEERRVGKECRSR